MCTIERTLDRGNSGANFEKNKKILKKRRREKLQLPTYYNHTLIRLRTGRGSNSYPWLRTSPVCFKYSNCFFLFRRDDARKTPYSRAPRRRRVYIEIASIPRYRRARNARAFSLRYVINFQNDQLFTALCMRGNPINSHPAVSYLRTA